MSEGDKITATPMPGAVQTVTVPDPTTSRGPSDAAQEKAAAEFLSERAKGNRDAQLPDAAGFEELDERNYRDKDLHFRGDREAHTHRMQQAEEDRQAERENAEAVEQLRVKKIDAEVHQTRHGWSDGDAHRGAAFQQGVHDWHQRAEAFNRDIENANRAIEQLRQTNPQQAAQLHAQLAPKLKAHSEAMMQELAVLHHAAQAWDAAGRTKHDRANFAQFVMRDVPELATEEERQAFGEWLIENGMTRDAVNAIGRGQSGVALERTKSFVKQNYLEFQKEKKQHRDRDFDRYMQRRAREAGVAWRSNGPDISKGAEQGLLDEVRKTGSEQAATMFLMAARTRARERSRGNL